MAKFYFSPFRILILLVLLILGITVIYNKESRSNWLGLNRREASLVQRLRESEDQVRWLGRQLRLTQSKQRKGGPLVSEPVYQSSCETIHVCIVCSGYNATRTVVTLLKSILYYRRSPLVFHFISDHSARKVLNHLATTWNLSQVEFRFYKAETVIGEVSWIPNKHYSGVYGLLKLTLPQILPKSLGKVIVLDTDVVFATDIGRLWTLMSQFNSLQALGLVENQSNWYIPGKLWKNHRPWPAIGRGFNTGVILMDLARLRKMNWLRLWRGVAENNLVTLLSTSLADQDVINAVISRQEGMVYRLPCSWNIQLSDNSLSDSLCLDTSKEMNIVHFNSPSKFTVKQSYRQFFRNLLHTFLQFDGNLLRGALFYCATDKETTTAAEAEDQAAAAEDNGDGNDKCHELRTAGRIVYRTHLFFLPYSTPAGNSTACPITLVTTLSFDRIHLLENLLTRWKGPTSLALYLTDYEALKLVEYYENSVVLRNRDNVAYHIIYKEGVYYPVNYLRNVAKKYVDTPYIFLCDIDFLPSDRIEENLLGHVTSLLQTGEEQKVLVVPAFETERYRADSLPGSKAELLKQLDLGQIITFRSRVWSAGHEATNYLKWRSSTQPYTVQWQKDFEPYIVGPKGMPDYDPRFIGFGWNKVSHIYQLHAQGYNFWVLPNVFIIHLPHTPSLDIHRYRSSSTYRRCMESMKQEFTREIDDKYGEATTATP